MWVPPKRLRDEAGIFDLVLVCPRVAIGNPVSS